MLQRRPLRRVREQQNDAAIDRCHRRLMSSEQQPRRKLRDGVIGQGWIMCLRCEQVGNDILRSLLTFATEQLEHVSEELAPTGLRAARVGHVGCISRPLAEPVTVLGWHAQKFADDEHREGEGQSRVKVNRWRLAQHVVDELIGELLDARPEQLHPLCGERTSQQGAHARVIGPLGVR